MSTRRQFLESAGKLAIAAAATSLPRYAYASPMGLPPGIQLYAVRTALQTDPAGTLKKLFDIGYREVETAGFAGKTATQFRALLDAAGLRCPSAHLALSSPDLEPLFADAHALGAQYATSSSLLRTPAPTATKQPGDRPAKRAPMQLEDFKRFAQQMNEIGRKAKAGGLQYAYHNHNIEFSKLPDGSYGYDLLLRETDPELVKFEADCGWFAAAGVDPIGYLAKYPGRYRMLHVKDFRPMTSPSISLDAPERPLGTELGQGFVKYESIFAAARKAGIQHAFAEQEGPYERSELESAQVGYNFLKKFS